MARGVTRRESRADKVARLELEVDDEEIVEKISNGVFAQDIILELGIGWKVWSMWLDNREGRRREVEKARENAAHFFASRAVKTAQGASSENVNVARLQVDTDKWVAGRFNEMYDARQRDISVNINVGDLHAQALELMRDVTPKDVIDHEE